MKYFATIFLRRQPRKDPTRIVMDGQPKNTTATTPFLLISSVTNTEDGEASTCHTVGGVGGSSTRHIENLEGVVDGISNSKERGSSACPIIVEDDAMHATPVETDAMKRLRIRSMVVGKTKMLDNERFMELNREELEEVKQEEFDKTSVFTKRAGKRTIKEEDTTLIESDSDGDDTITTTKRRFVQGFPSKRVKDE